MVEYKSNSVQVHIFKIVKRKIFFLVLKRSKSEKIYPGIWQCITGTIENNEPAYKTALREISEEIGLNPKEFYNNPILGTYYNPLNNSINLIPSFAVEIDNDTLIQLSEEHSKFKWLKYKKAYKRLNLFSHKNSLKVLNYNIKKNFINIYKINNQYQ
jgi:dATP pyrophosphohydrolase